MTKRIFRSICVVAIVVFLSAVVLIMGVLYNYFSNVQMRQLKMQTTLAAQGANNTGTEFIKNIDTQDYRVTWIDADGMVLYDSETESSEMENHGERNEIAEALESGYGESIRHSDTLMENQLYSAMRLDDGTVIRLSIAQSTVINLLMGMIQPILIVFVVAVVLSLVLASRLSKKIVKPLNELNLDEPLSNEGYDELSPLLRRIDSQQRELKAQRAELIHKQEEFDTVTKSMNEGLVLLNNKGIIISINSAARMILDTDKSCIGSDILLVNRSMKIQELIQKASEGSKSEGIVEIEERVYQFDVSPVYSEDSISGAVLLIFDVTERENAEEMRREFTANVSHELKTPLHSISGYAELMKNRMVKPEDLGLFSEKIYFEAQRMICLIEDIIRLSRLDEGAEDMKREQVELLSLAEKVSDELEGHAVNAGVKLVVSGEPVVFTGVSQQISGIIYNLCDNAIKYNREGGSVNINVGSDGNNAVLTVKDTGIGISPEHQNRIFERFYRVDKSHSKEVGGTGLGLSIVKHAAKLHNAEIKLHSVVGEGTEITVKFPK
ncbi:MAG: PAS domain-containing sensor histidine kinase [Lachnospiraceae bacterium]|nr:PAS domain-containing sensor histidine kinase [Lachnospiraceae bacterium]